MNPHFTIICVGRNCKDYAPRCLDSICTQDYNNYDIIAVDDASTDGTRQILDSYSNWFSHLQVVYNEERRYQVYNTVLGCRLSKLHSVCVEVDLDDWLPNDQVLTKLSEVYSDDDTWLAFSTYKHASGTPLPTDCHGPYPKDVVDAGSYRAYAKQLFSHIRTWRRELLLKVNEQDFLVNGEWPVNSGDTFLFYPMLELSGYHTKFIPEALYVYNETNPLCDYKVAPAEQLALADVAKAKSRYEALEYLY